MKKAFFLSLSVILILVLGYQFVEIQQKNKEKKIATNVYQNNFLFKLGLFGIIMERLAKVWQEEDLENVSGLSFFYLNTDFIFAVMDSNLNQIHPDISKEISLLSKNQKEFIKKIKPLLDARDLNKIKQMKDLFITLHQLVEELKKNSNLDYDQQYLNTLKKMNSLLSESIEQLTTD